MDKRNSKETLLKEIKRLKAKCEKVYEVGLDGIGRVGSANYQHIEDSATENLHKAYWED